MTDIVERINRIKIGSNIGKKGDRQSLSEPLKMLMEAADEIERLRANYKELAAHHNQHCICREIY
jgi:hypothetical protein